ncbi:hypothetical protein DAPPUDRAFT_235817 [Daphnia pulex]|uniref:Uncharacterized protein n=1 Tax=Daphnia pulex TaxID=6669 RepID=E9G0X6_DAPPU|nr:hypothetical protein DAPPUDRAFT_235817 [Daphnia pulex]|eukprot:EFX86980.1 hypothetical protein DAPPUDRAFT_235817 [Daphnia pulex]
MAGGKAQADVLTPPSFVRKIDWLIYLAIRRKWQRPPDNDPKYKKTDAPQHDGAGKITLGSPPVRHPSSVFRISSSA